MKNSKISAQTKKVLRKFLYKKHWLCNVIFFIIHFLFKKILNKKIKKRQKEKELEIILKQFDDFKFNNKEKGKIKERLLAYIPYVNRVIQQFENTKHQYIRLNISFATLISLFPTIFIVYFKIEPLKLLPIIYGSLVWALLIIVNLIYFQFKNPTKNPTKTTLWFYRGNVPDKKKPNISKDLVSKFLKKFHRAEEDFIIEDLKQLFNLYLYQANYNNLAKKSRINSRIIISVYFIYIFIQFLIFPYLN